MMISDLEKNIIDLYQGCIDFCENPYLEMAKRLNVSEAEIIQTLVSLKERGVISRVGAVFSPNKIGKSCLAALKIDRECLDEIADKISELDCINHNYEREHEYNLWFVVTAENQNKLDAEIKKISEIAKQDILVLPLEKEFFIDLGFDIDWKSI